MKKTTLIAGLALISVALPVVAQPAGGPMERGDRPVFEELDANGDGAVTLDEIEARRGERFAEVDADGDGLVTREEFTARAVAQATERAEAMFERLDADGDGTLTRDVLEARGPRGGMEELIFARLDTDGDGSVTEEEFDAAMERRAGMHEGRGGMGHGKHGNRHN